MVGKTVLPVDIRGAEKGWFAEILNGINGLPETTNLGFRSSNLFGRAISLQNWERQNLAVFPLEAATGPLSNSLLERRIRWRGSHSFRRVAPAAKPGKSLLAVMGLNIFSASMLRCSTSPLGRLT